MEPQNVVALIIIGTLVAVFLLYLWAIHHCDSEGIVGFFANLVVYLPKLLIKIAIFLVILYVILSVVFYYLLN